MLKIAIGYQGYLISVFGMVKISNVLKDAILPQYSWQGWSQGEISCWLTRQVIIRSKEPFKWRISCFICLIQSIKWKVQTRDSVDLDIVFVFVVLWETVETNPRLWECENALVFFLLSDLQGEARHLPCSREVATAEHVHSEQEGEEGAHHPGPGRREQLW